MAEQQKRQSAEAKKASAQKAEPEPEAEPTQEQPQQPEQPPAAEEAADDRTFSKERYLGQDGGALLGYPSHEVVLGLDDLDDDAELSVSDAKARIAEALERPLED